MVNKRRMQLFGSTHYELHMTWVYLEDATEYMNKLANHTKETLHFGLAIELKEMQTRLDQISAELEIAEGWKRTRKIDETGEETDA